MARLNYCELFFILMCCFDALFVHFISCLDGSIPFYGHYITLLFIAFHLRL